MYNDCAVSGYTDEEILKTLSEDADIKRTMIHIGKKVSKADIQLLSAVMIDIFAAGYLRAITDVAVGINK